VLRHGLTLDSDGRRTSGQPRPTLSSTATSHAGSPGRGLREIRGSRPAAPRWAAAAWLLDGPAWPWLALGLDLTAMVGALGLALAWTQGTRSLAAIAPLLVFPCVGVVGLVMARGRSRRMDAGVLDDGWPLVAAVSIAGMLASAVQQTTDAGARDPRTVVVAWTVGLGLVGVMHVGVRLARRVVRVRGGSDRPTLIVGAGQVGARIARRLAARPHYGLRPVGFLDWAPPPAELVGGRPVPVLGEPGDLVGAVRRTGARQVVLAFSAYPDRSLVSLVRTCEALNVDVALVPRLFESTHDHMTYEPVGGLPLLGLRTGRWQGWRVRLKYALDRVAAAVLLVVGAPLMALIAAIILVTMGRPVVFRQRRVGHQGREFDLLKFRTMSASVTAEPSVFDGALDQAPGGVEGQDRRTQVGVLLRRTSLDELPQLVNVLRGQMSLVGPRPERPEFVEMFRETLERYDDRHRVRPGITGCAQVKGLRGQTSLVERIELDNFYIEHWSFVLDAKTLVRTLLAAFHVPE
jgi:exopolysaccharide biosynthesis polyprenyl glycosylphosphotransferase